MLIAVKRENIPTQLGVMVKKLREQRGLSQFDLAVKARVAPATIHKIEVGKTAAPGMTVLQNIANALGVATSVLTRESEPTAIDTSDDWRERAIREYAPNTPTPISREFLSLLDDLDANSREAARAMLEGLIQARRKQNPSIKHGAGITEEKDETTAPC